MRFSKQLSIEHPQSPLYWNLLLMTACTILATSLLYFDQRIISGSLAWIKPIKFSLSLGIYSLTLVWIIQFFDGHIAAIKRLSWIITIMGWIEIVAIFGQVARGEQSHFNISTPLNSFIFSLMGISITIFWISHLILSFRLFKMKSINPFLKESLLWGMLIAAYAMIIGFFMTSPRPEQIELMKSGIVQTNGSHTFGAPDGGPGIFFFGWSTIAGDLRVAHFFGMHAMQVFTLIPILILGLSGKNQSFKNHNFALRLLGIAIFGITLVMTVQALNGESIFRSTSLFQGFYLFFTIITICSLFMFSLKFNPTKEVK